MGPRNTSEFLGTDNNTGLGESGMSFAQLSHHHDHHHPSDLGPARASRSFQTSELHFY